ncbi:hypothetical protein PV326_000700, partial [Microctonus aethiopoides]
MSLEDKKINHEWQLRYNPKKLIRSFATINEMTYSCSFSSYSIPNVRFEMYCCVSVREVCYVILSKKPHTPVNATIAIECMSTNQIEQIHVDQWTDNCILKLQCFENNQQDFDEYDCDDVPVVMDFQCTITLHYFGVPKPQVLDNLCDRFKNFLTTSDLSDMTIVIDEKEIKVHKIILAAYSPIFLALFKADMSTESVNEKIIVTDIESDIMEKVIEFMYTGVIDPVLDFNVLLSILEVANKYEIIVLKELCEKKLSENMTINNVLKILERASLYGVPQLIETLISFMVERKSQIVALEDFADLYSRKPELLHEFFIRSI